MVKAETASNSVSTTSSPEYADNSSRETNERVYQISGSDFASQRNDPPLALEQVSEAENRAMLVLNVMCGSHCHVRMVKHFLRSCESVARVDLAAMLFAQSVQRGL